VEPQLLFYTNAIDCQLTFCFLSASYLGRRGAVDTVKARSPSHPHTTHTGKHTHICVCMYYMCFINAMSAVQKRTARRVHFY